MSHVFKKSEKRISDKRYLEVRRKTARVGSGNTIVAKKYIRKLDKENANTKNNTNK